MKLSTLFGWTGASACPRATGALRELGRRKRLPYLLLVAAVCYGQPRYDLLLEGGHVIDAKNGISAVRDVAIKDGRIAAVAARLDAGSAFKVIDVSGLY